MVNIPYIKIPQIHIRGISSARNIYPAQDSERRVSPAPPAPIIYLTQWQIVGNSEVHGQEIWSCGEPRTDSITLYDSTKELLDGFLPQSGSYPTTNSSYPNAKYYVFNVKAGYVVRTQGFTNGHIRMRLIDNNSVMRDIGITDTEYYKSSWDAFNNIGGQITFKKDCQVGLMFLNTSSLPIENGSVVALCIQYHILVQPLGGSIADIALAEPLRKTNDGADTIELASYLKDLAIDSVYEVTNREFSKLILDAEDHILYGLRWDNTEYTPDLTNDTITIGGVTYNAQIIVDVVKDETGSKALVTRNMASILLGYINFTSYNSNPDRLCFDAQAGSNRSFVAIALLTNTGGNIMVASYENVKWSAATNVANDMCIGMSANGDLRMRDLRYNDLETFKAHIADYEMLFLLATPTTELVDAPQIEEAESYSCVISQGAKAVSWSDFETS